MRKSPPDVAFNRVVKDEVLGASVYERVIFIDTDNHIREAIYPPEFNGVLKSVRQRLEDSGVLKAVVHIAAYKSGDHGPRTTLVEYLPDHWVYTIDSTAPFVAWKPADETDAQRLKRLFQEGREEED